MAVGSTMRHSLTRQWWRCVVLDEGHKIKNEETDVSEACRRIRATHRVLLTGTPMQNNLHELWAMLNFLLPDVFVSSLPFDKCFDLAKGHVDKDMLDRAHHLMQLFSLRRLKSDVEISLPPKHELKISVPLSDFQVRFCPPPSLLSLSLSVENFLRPICSVRVLALKTLRTCLRWFRL